MCVCTLSVFSPCNKLGISFYLKCLSVNIEIVYIYIFIYFFFFRLFSVVHCRCSKCYSVPTRKRIRKRTPALGLLSLPEEIILCVLQRLSAEDLLSVRAVSKCTGHAVTPTPPRHHCHVRAMSARICSGLWPPDWVLSTNCCDFCFRFTPSCGTLWTTTLVCGPGSVSGTHGRPPTPCGYLKGTVISFSPHNKLRFCVSYA